MDQAENRKLNTLICGSSKIFPGISDEGTPIVSTVLFKIEINTPEVQFQE